MPRTNNVIVEAKPGTGKTWLLVETAKRLRKHSLTRGSDQQEAVMSAAAIGDPRFILCCAFNRSIREEMEKRMPTDRVDCRTFNSVGCRALFTLKPSPKQDDFKTRNLMAEMTGCPFEDMPKEFAYAVESLVEKIRITLTPIDDKFPALKHGDDPYLGLSILCDRFNIDLPKDELEVFDLAIRLVKKHAEDLSRYDFTDQLWLPLRLGLSLRTYDLIMVDEAQDLNACSRELILAMSNRFVVVGDPQQAINGFAGADINSMERFENELSARSNGAQRFPLTETRRCSHAITAYARSMCPSFSALPQNPQGSISRIPNELWNKRYLASLTPKDFILCRTNGPLISLAFNLMAEGRKIQMIGRDFSKSIIRTMDRASHGSNNIDDVLDGLTDMTAQKLEQWNGRAPSDDTLNNWHDRVKIIRLFCMKYKKVDAAREQIVVMFSEEGKEDCIRLSSIHRAKGLEGERVHFLNENARMRVRSNEERQQEENLRFVGVTRGINDLRLVQQPLKPEADEFNLVPEVRKPMPEDKVTSAEIMEVARSFGPEDIVDGKMSDKGWNKLFGKSNDLTQSWGPRGQ